MKSKFALQAAILWGFLSGAADFRARLMYYDYLREQSGKHFDPRVLDLFLAVVSEWEAEWAAKQKVFTALG